MRTLTTEQIRAWIVDSGHARSDEFDAWLGRYTRTVTAEHLAQCDQVHDALLTAHAGLNAARRQRDHYRAQLRDIQAVVTEAEQRYRAEADHG